LWSYNNEEFRPKRCSYVLYRPQRYDLYVKMNDLKAWYVPFKYSPPINIVSERETPTNA